MWIASNRVLAATAGMLALAGVALAADTGGGATGTGGAPEGQPTSPDSPTIGGPGGREPGAGIGEGQMPRDRRDEPSGEPMTPPGAPPGDHHRNHE
jgi:hypothetical protein